MSTKTIAVDSRVYDRDRRHFADIPGLTLITY